MNISRKDFFTTGIASFSRDLLRAFNGEELPSPVSEDFTEYASLLVDNRHCLAQRGGCFSCIDHCPKQAISIQLGAGIAINDERCDACGKCVDICPVKPRVITMNTGRRDES